MKNTIQFAMLAIVGAIMCSCTVYGKHTDYAGVNGGYGLSQQLPAKDYESKGLVFATLEFNSNVAHSVTEDKSVVAFELLKKAQAIGADDIINVRIIRKTTRETIDNNEQEALSASTTYYGSALAIKYTDAILCGMQHKGKKGMEAHAMPIRK